ncbi:MAG: PEP-CTERM sorting domain-containing protein [Aeoliella sp.]
MGVIDEADYDFWKSGFGDSLPAASLTTAVPEPGAFALIAMGIVLLARLRRRT